MLRELAARCGVTEATVSRVFHGVIRKSPEVKRAIEQYLDGIQKDEIHKEALDAA